MIVVIVVIVVVVDCYGYDDDDDYYSFVDRSDVYGSFEEVVDHVIKIMFGVEFVLVDVVVVKIVYLCYLLIQYVGGTKCHLYVKVAL